MLLLMFLVRPFIRGDRLVLAPADQDPRHGALLVQRPIDLAPPGIEGHVVNAHNVALFIGHGKRLDVPHEDIHLEGGPVHFFAGHFQQRIREVELHEQVCV